MTVLGHAPVNAVPLPPAPSPEEIQEQLDRILSSPEFVVPPRARAFLSYVVEETLAGRAARIKGYSIAIEVFGRDAGFTQDDPVVRIEAGRLRRALERYFLVAGQADPIRIEIPLGRYVPVFARSASTAPALSEPAAVEPAAMPGASKPFWLSWERAHWLATGALALVAGFTSIAYWSSHGSVAERPPPSAPVADSDGPTLVVAPFADLGEGPQAKVYAVGLTEELLSVLPRFKELTVMGRETSEALTSQADPSHVREKLGAHYLLTGGVQVSGERIRVTSRLTDTEDGAILWSQSYNDDLRSRDIFAIQSDVAAQVATVVAQPYGVIYQADLANAPPDDLDAYRCTLQFYAYRAALSAELHGAVRGCLERAVTLYPNFVTAWSMLSIAYLDEDRFGFNPRSGSPTALVRSLAAARRAVELDPRNVRALQALMTGLFFNNQLAESMEVGEKALVLNPNDTEFLGEFGTRLASGGQWQRGAALLQEALARNPGASGYYHAMLALSAHMLGDDRMSLSEIRQANVTNLPLVHLIAAIIYAQNGMADEATREGAAFVKLRPDFLPNIKAELTKRNFQPDDQLKMIAGLRKAGLLPGGTTTTAQ